jgi:hypothetical protein
LRALGQNPIPPFLATGEVATSTRHDDAGVDDVERNQSDKHRKGVEQVLVDFVGDRGALCAFGIFAKTEDDANLNKVSCQRKMITDRKVQIIWTYRNAQQRQVHGVQQCVCHLRLGPFVVHDSVERECENEEDDDE